MTGDSESIAFYPDAHTIFSGYVYSGIEEGQLYLLSNGTLTETATYVRNNLPTATTPPRYTVNGKSATEAEYNAANARLTAGEHIVVSYSDCYPITNAYIQKFLGN